MKISLNKREYELLYDGLLGSPRGYNGAERRIGGAILNKLEAWGSQTDTSNGPTYRLTGYDQAEIELTEIEAKLAITQLDAVSWTGRVVREITRLLAKLGSQDDATI